MALSDYKIKFQIEGETRDIDQALDRVYGRMNNIGGAATAAFGGFIPVAQAAAVAVGAIGLAAAGVGVAMFNLTKSTAEFGSEIYDASQKTGLGATAISSLKAAAETSGSSLEAVTKGIAKFAKEYKGTSGDLQGELGKVMQKIADARPGFEQLQLAQKAFGKSGAELIPIIRSFDGDLPGLIKHMEELGVTIDDQAAYAADAFGDQMDLLNMQLAGVGRTIGTVLMPEFTRMAGYISNWLVQNKSEVESFAGRVGAVFSNLIRGFTTVVNFVRENETSLRVGLALITGGSSEIAIQGGGWFLNTISTPRKTFGAEATGEVYRSMTNDPGGTKGGKGIKPPKENDSEFRKFFTEMGFVVGRTFGAALNKGSLHPSGLAADIRIGGKTDDQIAKLIAAALEKGYRLVDERVRPAGQKGWTGPHLHFERTGSETPSRFLDGRYGSVPTGYLRGLDARRTGRVAGGATAVSEWEQQESDKRIAIAIRESERKKEIGHATTNYLIGEGERQIEALLAQGLDDDAIKQMREVSGLKIQTLQDELEALKEVHAQQKEGSEAQRDAWHKVELKTIELQAAEAESARVLEKAILDVKIARDEITDATRKYREELEKLREVNLASPGLYDKPNPVDAKGRPTFGSDGNAIDYATKGERALEASSNWLKDLPLDTLNQFAEGIGAVVENLILMGSAGENAMAKLTASVLAGVSRQATVLAIKHLAFGIAALTPWGAAEYGPASNQFMAAALFGSIAVGTGVAGRAIAGNKFNGGGSSGTSSSIGSGRNYDNQQPYQRASETAFYSGTRDPHTARLAAAVERLDRKLASMSPGDVLTAGARQRRGFIGNEAVSDIRSSRVRGTDVAKAMGMR